MNWPNDYINKIIQGDCLEVMKGIPDNSIDLILTDPPYGLNFNNGDLASQREKVFGGKLSAMAPNPIENDGIEAREIFIAFLRQAKRILKKGACCCCCCGGGGPKPLFADWTLLMDKEIGFKHAVVWDKGGLGMGLHYRRNYEFILIAQNGNPINYWGGGNDTPNLWRFPKIIPQSDEHPTAKPVELFKYCINIHSQKGDVVLDPFIGHGTTAVACKDLDRKYIGIEISEKYCEIARKRVERHIPNLRLFD